MGSAIRNLGERNAVFGALIEPFGGPLAVDQILGLQTPCQSRGAGRRALGMGLLHDQADPDGVFAAGQICATQPMLESHGPPSRGPRESEWGEGQGGGVVMSRLV